jgi:SAM-dependent methyltransferase
MQNLDLSIILFLSLTMLELILRRDPRLKPLIDKFESKDANDVTFLEQLHELVSNEAHYLYEDLFADTSLEVGKALSKSEREEKQLNEDKSLIYGEVEFASFYRVLRKINPEPGLTFYDLGSGTGKALFIARLVQDFSKCVGIEILESLHIQAEKIVHR